MLKMLGGTILALALGSAPALAVQYDCQFAADGVVKSTCRIDSTTGNMCVYPFYNALTGTCAGSDYLVACVFHNGALTAAEVNEQLSQLTWPSGQGSMKAAKGFQAVSFGAGQVIIGLVEKAGATQYVMACSG